MVARVSECSIAKSPEHFESFAFERAHLSYCVRRSILLANTYGEPSRTQSHLELRPRPLARGPPQDANVATIQAIWANRQAQHSDNVDGDKQARSIRTLPTWPAFASQRRSLWVAKPYAWLSRKCSQSPKLSKPAIFVSTQTQSGLSQAGTPHKSGSHTNCYVVGIDDSFPLYSASVFVCRPPDARGGAGPRLCGGFLSVPPTSGCGVPPSASEPGGGES